MTEKKQRKIERKWTGTDVTSGNEKSFSLSLLQDNLMGLKLLIFPVRFLPFKFELIEKFDFPHTCKKLKITLKNMK